MNILVNINKENRIFFKNLILFSFITLIQFNVFAAEKRVVKVAYFNMGNYYIEQDNKIQSFDSDVLEKIEDYSNLSFEYVNCGTWSNALEMLRNHEVELLGTAQWNADRDKQYSFCHESYGYSVGQLATLPNFHVYYEDYPTIENSVIGCITNYINENELLKIFAQNNVSPTILHYKDQEALEEAFKAGEIDIIAANSHTMAKEWSIVEQFSYSAYYFVSWKGNSDLTNLIDDILIKIKLDDPKAYDNLLKKYFPNILSTPFTKEEKKLIDKSEPYYVYFSTDAKPLSWYDKKTKTMEGAFTMACEQIFNATGLKILVRPQQEATTSTTGNSISFIPIFHDSSKIKYPENSTNSFLEEPFNLYYKVGRSIVLDVGSYSIGIVENRYYLKEYIEEKFPNCKIIPFKNPVDCIKELQKENVDLAYLDVHIANNALTELSIDNIRELPRDEDIIGMGFLFTGENEQLLTNIVNKGIAKIDLSKITDSLINYSLSTSRPLTLKTLISDYFILFAIGLTIILIIIVLIPALLAYANMMRREKEAIKKIDNDRSEFFARMSHDMRTPMNGILGMIELTEKATTMDEVLDNMGKAKEAGTYMLSLINDTLDLQKLEKGKTDLNTEVTYLQDYFENLFATMKLTADTKNIKFTINNINVDTNKYVEIDKIRTSQIFSNLLSNAFKFTPENGNVEVSMESIKDEDYSLVKFSICDNGIGISDNFLNNQIFKPYAQENAQLTGHLTGTGLGLAITKNLIESMNGTIRVESELGKGSNFIFTLYFKNVTENDAKKTSVEQDRIYDFTRSELKGKRILICEDIPMNAEILTKILEMAGCEVVWAENGKLGLDILANSAENSFDEVLMDIKMPVMDGLETTRNIRSLNRNDAKKIPIIAITANAYADDIKKSLDAGMNAHLAKPVVPQKLYETMVRYIS